MARIEVEGVRKVFGSQEALRAVSLEVRDREFTVLLGPSGCGKTTLLRIIAGLETETAGVVRIGDRVVTGLPPRARKIAMVFQNYAVFPHMTVFENVAFGLRMRKAPAAEVDRRVREAAQLTHIDPFLARYPAQLSGGQRQRVAVARALAVEPEVLLMDEPLSNLDALLRLEMRAELKGLLQASRTTTIYVTHDQVEAMSLADRIAVMHAGEIVQYAPPLAVYQDPASTLVGSFIGSPPMNFLTVAVTGTGTDAAARIGDDRIPAPAGLPARAILGVRPEDLEVAGVAEADTLRGRVQLVEPLGPHLQLTVALGDQTLRVTAPPHTAVHPGATVRLRLRGERLRWFDAESGRALLVGGASGSA
jgi:multiple sugar transport system ATP-binding protein